MIEAIWRKIQVGLNLRALDGREIGEKIINRIAALEVVDEGLNRYSSAGENEVPAVDFRIARDNVLQIQTIA